ncbi:MAG: hypothetical protein V4675_01945 [Verrucomicrobiota bacterium]
MKLNGLSVLFLLAALGMGGWAVWEERKGAALQEKLASVSQERDVLRMTANKKLALGSKTEVKQDGPEGLGPDHAKALEEETKGKEKPAAGDENPMAGVAKMMKDPAMREMMKSQMRSQVDFMYRDLFDLLGLEAGKQEQLTKLLVERAGAGMDLGFSMMGGEKISDEERKKKTEALAAATAESDKALKALLGDDYAKFDSFEKSQPERQQLNTLNGLLKDKGIALSEEAESKLMDTMFKERTNFKYDVDLSDQKTMDPGKFTAENLSRFQEQQAVLRGQILSKVEPILTPDQLEVFRKSQEQQAAMEKMGMEMAQKMMGGKKAE